MRRAFTSTSWIEDSAHQVIGLSTGSDACSEHEWGIKDLRSAMGIPQKFERGVADRVMTKTPVVHLEEYQLSDGTPAAWWIFASSHYQPHLDGALKNGGKAQMPNEHELRFFDQQDLACAWDEHGLMAHVRGEQNVERLRQLHQQALAHNLVLGGSLLTSEQKQNAGGIILVQADRIDPEIAAKALAEDQSNVRLRNAAAAIGLDEELRQAGKRWFALSPRWKDKEESEVVYWLNPMDQRDYHSGLYTVDELRQWARNEGPIMIDKPLEAQVEYPVPTNLAGVHSR